MNITKLSAQMELIAASLITTSYITDFTVHDRNFIRRTNAQKPFAWMVYYSGTHIYNLAGIQEIRQFNEMLEHFEKYSGNDFCLYRYDGEKLFPVFPKAMHGWIDSKLREYPH